MLHQCKTFGLWSLGAIAIIRLVASCAAGEFSCVPSARPLAWSEREFTVFIHFGMNTFSDLEWGEGTEDPRYFNPRQLDARQWVEAIRGAGASDVVLVCKHHDGFCLWPSQYTAHSVRQSPWREGRGDVVREVSDACRDAGLRFGVYLSPGDLHEPTYGTDSIAYNEFFRNQLRELLTGYGPISEVWFDGAKPSRRTQHYDFPGYYRLIRELQPEAMIASKGPDVRWVGNESGVARESEWSVIPLPVPAEQYDWPDLRAADLGSRARLAGAKALQWYPAVCDVSLGPTWFWVPKWDHELKSLDRLKQIYETSVGRNAGLLLNVAPNREGVIPEPQVRRLREFGQWQQAGFASNRLAQVTLKPVPVATSAAAVPVLEARFDAEVVANTLVLREDIARGQLVERMTVEGLSGGTWWELARATTVGRKRILRWPLRNLDGLRVTIHETRGELHLLPPELYRVAW